MSAWVVGVFEWTFMVVARRGGAGELERRKGECVRTKEVSAAVPRVPRVGEVEVSEVESWGESVGGELVSGSGE